MSRNLLAEGRSVIEVRVTQVRRSIIPVILFNPIVLTTPDIVEESIEKAIFFVPYYILLLS